MSFRLAGENETPTHAAYRQYDPVQSVLPILVVFKIVGLHGCPCILSDAEYGEIINLVAGDTGPNTYLLIAE